MRKLHIMFSTFSERLKELRTDKNLTFDQLARKIGTDGSTVSKWEKGFRQPTLPWVIKLAQYFGVTLGYLAGLEE